MVNPIRFRMAVLIVTTVDHPGGPGEGYVGTDFDDEDVALAADLATNCDQLCHLGPQRRTTHFSRPRTNSSWVVTGKEGPTIFICNSKFSSPKVSVTAAPSKRSPYSCPTTTYQLWV
jgi:hypothetical protein